MGLFDKLLAFAAPASFHALEGYNNNEALKGDLAKFQADPTYRIDPAKYDTPEFAIAAQNHLDALTSKQQAREAAPTANALARFSAEGNGSDVNFPQGEWTQGMMDLSGVKPPANNPVAAKAITDFMTQGGAERDAQLAARGDAGASARIASNKDRSISFKDTSMGAENYDKMRVSADSRTQQSNAAKAVARLDTGTYGDANTSPSMAVRRAIAGESKNYTDPVALGLLEKFAKDVDTQWGGQAYNRSERTIGTGNATKKIVEVTDPLGKFVKTEEVANHPKSSGGGVDPSSAPLYVSWRSPDGTANGAMVPRSELPAFKSSLEAQGVKEIETVDGKRASRTETLIKPEKKKRSGLGDRPGGGAAPAAVSVVRDANGNLTVKR